MGGYLVSENYVLVEHWLLLDIFCHLVVKLNKNTANVHYAVIEQYILEAQHHYYICQPL